MSPDTLNRWRLVYPGRNLPFGDRASGFPLTGQQSISRGEARTQDVPNSFGDGLGFGVDHTTGMTVGFALAVMPADMDPETATWWQPGLDLHASFVQAWDAVTVRSKPTAVAELHHDGRGRVIYGRPRRWAPAYDRLRGGWSGISADFAANGTTWYSQQVKTVLAQLIPASTGGLTSPLVSPITSVHTSDGLPSYVDNVGTLDTPARFTMQGPCTNPEVTLFNTAGAEVWQVRLETTIAGGSSITVDARPWVLTVVRNGGSPAAGVLRGSSLDDVRVPASGAYRVEYRATDPSGLSRMEFSWQDAFPSW